MRYSDRISLWEKAAQPKLSGRSAVALEFGVADGSATRWWAQRGVDFAEWHGFDTFEGLPTDWARAGVPVMSAGAFTPSDGAGSVPNIESQFPYIWHKGLIQDTLPGFQRPDAPLFVMIDVDLLDPTFTILEWLRAAGRPGDLIYFDEAFDPWNEGLALSRAIDNGLRLNAIGHTGSSLVAEVVSTGSFRSSSGDLATETGPRPYEAAQMGAE